MLICIVKKLAILHLVLLIAMVNGCEKKIATSGSQQPEVQQQVDCAVSESDNSKNDKEPAVVKETAGFFVNTEEQASLVVEVKGK